jgi:hypothetical protein
MRALSRIASRLEAWVERISVQDNGDETYFVRPWDRWGPVYEVDGKPKARFVRYRMVFDVIGLGGLVILMTPFVNVFPWGIRGLLLFLIISFVWPLVTLRPRRPVPAELWNSPPTYLLLELPGWAQLATLMLYIGLMTYYGRGVVSGWVSGTIFATFSAIPLALWAWRWTQVRRRKPRQV